MSIWFNAFPASIITDGSFSFSLQLCSSAPYFLRSNHPHILGTLLLTSVSSCLLPGTPVKTSSISLVLFSNFIFTYVSSPWNRFLVFFSLSPIYQLYQFTICYLQAFFVIRLFCTLFPTMPIISSLIALILDSNKI